ncbi:MAG TPA: hypothetical protein VFW86_06860, partial [Candidatus Limnocylindrales bacterium]|nr:hypothetical protein [Candidatus Limnocylindrales bacterium]
MSSREGHFESPTRRSLPANLLEVRHCPIGGTDRRWDGVLPSPRGSVNELDPRRHEPCPCPA